MTDCLVKPNYAAGCTKSLKDRNAFFVSFLRNNSIFPASTGGQFIQILMAKKMASKVFENGSRLLENEATLTMTPTARTLHHLRSSAIGRPLWKREPLRQGASSDLFNIGDVLGLKAGEPLLLIQATVTAKLNERMRKDPETVAQWVSTGNRFQYWGWSKGGKARRKTWQLTCGASMRTPKWWTSAC